MDGERDKAVKCLRQLRNLLTDAEDLKVPIHDEKFLIRFVRAKKYDAQLAYETVRKYYTLRKKSPRIFKIAYPSYKPVKQLLEKNAVMKLKYNDPDGRMIIAWNFEKWDVEKHNLDHMIAALALMLEELLFSSVDAQINGIISIFNDEALSLSQIKHFSPGRVKSLLQLAQGSYPLRVKQVNIVKEPPIVDLLLSVLKPFMTTKFKDRMVFHGHDFEKLHAKLPAKILPVNYGGMLSDEEAYDDNFRLNLFQRDSYYKELLQYGYGEWDSDEEDTYM